MKLTKTEYKQVYKAIKLLQKKKTFWCCNALSWIADSSSLEIKFGKFYNKTNGGAWFQDEEPETQDIRIMLLTLFAEANK